MTTETHTLKKIRLVGFQDEKTRVTPRRTMLQVNKVLTARDMTAMELFQTDGMSPLDEDITDVEDLCANGVYFGRIRTGDDRLESYILSDMKEEGRMQTLSSAKYNQVKALADENKVMLMCIHRKHLNADQLSLIQA